MRKVVEHNQFKADLKRIKRSGRYKVADLLSLLDNLANDRPLDLKHRDHALSGTWSNHRECHIKPDWLLIYRLEPGSLILVRTGTHSDLF